MAIAMVYTRVRADLREALRKKERHFGENPPLAGHSRMIVEVYLRFQMYV